MKRWQQEFLDAIRRGTPAVEAARQFAGMPLSKVQDAAEEADNYEFKEAWDNLAPGDDVSDGVTVARVLSGGALEAILWAQCSDEEAAAFFGLDLDEFKERIEESPKLEKIYRLARTGGKAALKRAQMESALAGNIPAQTWLGKQHLGQADKVEHTGDKPALGAPVTINNIILRNIPTEQLEEMQRMALGIGHEIVIDVASERVPEESVDAAS